MDIAFIIAVCIVGGLLLLSFLHLSNVTGVNRRANFMFGIFAFLWSTFWLDEMVFPENIIPHGPIFIIVRILQFLAPITFILSVKFYTDPNASLKRKDTMLLVGPALFLLLLFVKSSIEVSLFESLYAAFFLVHALFYTVLASVKITKHQKVIERFHSTTDDIDLRWIKYIIHSFIGSALLIMAYNIITKAESLNVYVNLFFLGVVYLVAFYSIRQKEIYPKGLTLPDLIKDKSDNGSELNLAKNKLLNERELETLKAKLLDLMENEHPYLDSNLNLVKLSELMQLSPHQLSYLINAGFGANFFNFINGYRVRKAAELLKNPRYNHLNMLAIGYEAGFNSKTSFNTTFKKITSYTPTEYRNRNTC